MREQTDWPEKEAETNTTHTCERCEGTHAVNSVTLGPEYQIAIIM